MRRPRRPDPGRTGAALLLAALWLALPGSVAAATEVHATVDRTRVQVGEQVGLEIEVSGASNVRAPDLDDVPGFTVRYVGPSTRVSIVGGQMTQSVRHRYALMAHKPGKHTLGPFSVSIGGKTYRTAPVEVQVVARSGAAAPGHAGGARRRAVGGSDLELTLEVPSTKPYLHQRVPATLTLYVGATRIDDVEYPQLSSDAFAIEPFGKPVQRRVHRGGRIVQEVRFNTFIIPLHSGELTLGPATQTMSVLVNRGGRHGGLGRFFGSDFFAQRELRELQSNSVSLNVRPLPQVGRPADFSGAVGQFDFDVTAKPTEVDVNDPVTVTMRISGRGNLVGSTPPALDGPGFKVYPSRSLKSEENDGARAIEQVLIPTSATVSELPVVRFSYFDPEAGAYRTVSRGPIPLVVRPRQESPATPGVGAPIERRRRPATDAEQLGRDIVYIKDTPGRMRRGAPIYLRPWFLVVQLFPLGIYLVGFSVARRRQRLKGDPGYARFTRAGREARKAIAAVRRAAEAGEAGAVYDGLARAVREYLSAKLGLPVGAVDADRVAARVGGDTPQVVEHVREFLSLVEHMRYAPGADGASGQRALDLAEQIVRGLERHGGLAGRFDPRRPAALLAFVLVGAAMVAVATESTSPISAEATSTGTGTAARDPVTRFFESNARYKAGQYGEAAAGYGALVAAGFRSAPLYFNLGNAFFKQGALGNAVLNYERALRLSPRDPDVRANLRFARESADGDVGSLTIEAPLWLRVLVPLAFRASTAELAVATSILYGVLMLLLTIRLFVPGRRQLCSRAATVMAVALVVVASSAGLRLAEEQGRTTAVVTSDGPVSVRFEPSESGTVYFSLPEGAVVRQLSRRDGWYQVARGDGRRGWVKAGAVEAL